jgi:ectoine hydroxylase-related dioxygenase (phytanoyl-CoA dioxygenase family)
MEMGPLAFAPKSHLYDVGRDLEISDKSQQQIEKKLLAHNLGQFEEPFDLGEVSFHSGWTFHRAGRNLTDLPREVMTVIYMDETCGSPPRATRTSRPTGTAGAPARKSAS